MDRRGLEPEEGYVDMNVHGLEEERPKGTQEGLGAPKSPEA